MILNTTTTPYCKHDDHIRSICFYPFAPLPFSWLLLLDKQLLWPTLVLSLICISNDFWLLYLLSWYNYLNVALLFYLREESHVVNILALPTLPPAVQSLRQCCLFFKWHSIAYLTFPLHFLLIILASNPSVAT